MSFEQTEHLHWGKYAVQYCLIVFAVTFGAGVPLWFLSTAFTRGGGMVFGLGLLGMGALLAIALFWTIAQMIEDALTAV